jgi:hypothetical protein
MVAWNCRSRLDGRAIWCVGLHSYGDRCSGNHFYNGRIHEDSSELLGMWIGLCGPGNAGGANAKVPPMQCGSKLDSARLSMAGGSGSYILLAYSQVDQLNIGEQTARFRFTLKIYSSRKGPLIVTTKTQLTAVCELVDEDTPTAYFVNDPALKAEMEAALKPGSFFYYQNWTHLGGSIRVDAPPVGIALNVSAMANGK